MSEPAVADAVAVPPAPDPAPPTRARTGGMSRTRAGILAGAARCLVGRGTRGTTMGDIAREGGVAKATLYNHFRTKSEVWAALLAEEVAALLGEVAALPAPGTAEALRDTLALAAGRLSEHPVLRAICAREPALALALATPSDAVAWQAARRLLLQRVSLAQAAGALHPRHDTELVVDTLLRWVASHMSWPQSAAGCAAAARQLVAGLLVSPYDVGPDGPSGGPPALV